MHDTQLYWVSHLCSLSCAFSVTLAEMEAETQDMLETWRLCQSTQIKSFYDAFMRSIG